MCYSGFLVATDLMNLNRSAIGLTQGWGTFSLSRAICKFITSTEGHTGRITSHVVRAFALRLGGRGFDPRPGHTKTGKNGTQFLPAWHSASRVGLGCTVTMWCEHIHRLCAAWRCVTGSTPEPDYLCRMSPPISLPLSCLPIE